MISRRVKCLLVAAFSLFLLNFAAPVIAQEHKEEAGHGEATHGEEKKEGFDAQEVIFGHVLNGHEFHFFGASIPLPVILYSPERGFTAFMSSKFEHGHHDYQGYRLLTDESIKEMRLDPKQFGAADGLGEGDINFRENPTA